MVFSRDVLKIDPAVETERIVAVMREAVLKRWKRRGAVVGLSGGIDSSTTAALCVRAFGPGQVVGLLMCEDESSDDTLRISRELARHLGIEAIDENIAGILRAARCYERRDEALRKAIPDYGPGWKSKIVLPSVVDSDRYRVYSVVAQAPDGRELTRRLPLESYLGVVAATNFKQRTRKMLEYHHADRLNFAVAGTPNLLEYDQGFFVKNGDGAADFKPIAHLYKTQVYALAAHLGVPEEILRRPPTTDTYSLPQSQEEFYFSLPYDRMDLALWARNHAVPAAEAAPVLGLSPEQVERVYRDIDGKRAVTDYLGAPPLAVGA